MSGGDEISRVNTKKNKQQQRERKKAKILKRILNEIKKICWKRNTVKKCTEMMVVEEFNVNTMNHIHNKIIIYEIKMRWSLA